MKTFFTKKFRKAYKKRIQPNKNLGKRFEERYDIFIENPSNELLDDHALGSKLKGHRAFSITGDIRVVYYIHEEITYFVDIGTHNQVYGE